MPNKNPGVELADLHPEATAKPNGQTTAYPEAEGIPARAFALVPAESRGDLRTYFTTSPGKYALAQFLEALSEWWAQNQSLHGRVIEPRSLAGSWAGDPGWPQIDVPEDLE